MSRESLDEAFIAIVLDTIVPADGFSSAIEAGGLVFLDRVLQQDKGNWRRRVDAVLELIKAECAAQTGQPFEDLARERRLDMLDRLSDNPDYQWFAALVQQGFYGDPGNGGNDDAVAWRMLGWTRTPAGGWPPLDDAVTELDLTIRRCVVGHHQLPPRYDAVVIGSGAGGGVAAKALTASGRSVLLIERGDFPTTAYLAQDHLRNARTDIGFDHRTLPSSRENPRVLMIDGRSTTLAAQDPRWGSNANTFGGGTRVYGAQAWRYVPEDFSMATTYGVPEGSALADWPISYADLEPYYSQAEWEIGVCGSTVGDSLPVPRSREFPMPPMPLTAPARVLAAGASRLGISTLAVPLAINSVPNAGRPACARCAQCVGFACPAEAKNGSHNTVIQQAAATGRLSILLAARVERITTDGQGRVNGVAVLGDSGGSRWHAMVESADVVVSAGATETARLLLYSVSDREPHGLGNNRDQVGRHLQGHLYAGALGIFEEPVNDFVGPGPAIATNDFRHHQPGIVGGGMIANEFVPTPVSTFGYLRAAGLLGPHGASVKEAMRYFMPRMQRVVGPVQEMTSSASRVRLDPHVRDSFGIPVVQLSGGLHAEDRRTQAYLSERAARWLTASGAHTVTTWPRRPEGHGPSSGQHQAGTARMGTDPAHSVTDPYGLVWGHDNLRVVDGSLHVTNGGVNPVLTIFANSLRVMDHWLTGRA